MMKSLYISSVLFISLFAAAAAVDQRDDNCVYTIFVKTGSKIKAGTDSNISLSLGDSQGRSVWVSNLKSWGLMGAEHDYYERGNLDIFSGRGPCIDVPICRLNLTSDGTGSRHGWYCEYVEVTFTGLHKECSQTLFKVEQWLAKDVAPYKLTAEVDGCDLSDESAAKQGRFVVENHKEYAAAAVA